MEYEAVIGLEVHVQIKTRSKMFAPVGYRFGEPPNTLTDPVVWALPGVLPVLNRDAIRKTIKVGLMLGCEIPAQPRKLSRQPRKNSRGACKVHRCGLRRNMRCMCGCSG